MSHMHERVDRQPTREPVEITRGMQPIPTYPLPEPEAHPMFFDKRVYQGSSGRVYPLAFYTAVTDEKREVAWDVLELANRWVSVELLPELGGRIQSARHLPSGYDMFYRQPVIKPALVGLAGPWISGGVEFNWPQHHRPTTYMPADCRVERHGDGSATVWMGEHEAMDRMKELHGVRLRPQSSRIELHVRLYNRTPLRQTFMWWANVATEVHERYQSFFPADVHCVADHAVRAMSSFPVARNDYYGIDYRPGTDLTWYTNIPVPTSYMVLRSDHAFLGGYDHAADAGFVHVADRHVSPGKKQWTWGHGHFGWAWDRELTDARGDGRHPPYIELMAGVYTNNQPDFTYIQPYETKCFTQYWWPIRGLGPVQEADERAALRLVVTAGTIFYGTVASERIESATLRLYRGKSLLAEHAMELEPSEGHRFECALPEGGVAHELTLTLTGAEGELLRYQPAEVKDESVPAPAKAPPPPEEVESLDRLYLIGEHLEQYRHPTRTPEAYWQEGLRRDASDMRCRLGMGRRLLRRGLVHEALEHLQSARDRLIEWHPNPESGEVFYLLGLAYRRQGERRRAEQMFGKAAWDRCFVAPARYQLAQLHAERGDLHGAIVQTRHVLEADTNHQAAAVLGAAMLRHTGRVLEAIQAVDQVLSVDPLCFWAWWERGQCLRSQGKVEDARASDEAALAAMGDPSQTLLDVALDYTEAGLHGDALDALHAVDQPSTPMVDYARWWVARTSGDDATASEAATAAKRGGRLELFPVREQEAWILAAASDELVDDGQAPYLLGCLLYDRGRADEAIAQWQRCLERAPNHAGAHRNLGLALPNTRGESKQAMQHFERACAVEPEDARLIYELDQLRARMGTMPEERLARLEERPDLVESRDDLALERIELLLRLGREGDALEQLQQRRFHPWEGGEGKAVAAHVAARLGLGIKAMGRGCGEEALAHFKAALESPESLGEAKHPLAAEADIHAHLGWVCQALGRQDEARQWYERAGALDRDFSDMAVQAFSPMTFYKGWALRRMGRADEAQRTFEALRDHARHCIQQRAEIDYFATSLPNLLVLDEDLQRRHEWDHRYLEALALRGLGEHEQADAQLARLSEDDPNQLGARQMQWWNHLKQ